MRIPHPVARHVIAAALLALFGYVLVMTAWLSDDAFIGLRSVAHLVHGDGFVWNIGERVQTFTAPLWTLSVGGLAALTGDPCVSTLALAFPASLAAFALLVWKAAPATSSALFGGLVLILSKAFTDYSTGGLENPFTHLFVVLGWFALVSGEPQDRRTLGRFAIVAGLATTNRLDTVLLFAPALAWLSWCVGLRRAILPLLIGFLPVIAWIVFSIVYYGFPFPNTAYAKAFTVGIDRLDLLKQGLGYLDDSRQRDPITLVVIAIGLFAALVVGAGMRRAFVLGSALYVVYVLWIGGDYMSGRFLSGPLMVAVVALASKRFDRKRVQIAFGTLGVVVAVILGIVLVPCKATVLSDREYQECLPKIQGITDERGFYYSKGLGLLSPVRRDPVADYADNPFKGRKLVVWNMMGYAAFIAPRQTHVIDLYGLGDPILARLPNRLKVAAGHYRRAIPDGYLRTLATGKNVITDPSLRAYWDRLHLVQAGRIWSAERLRSVFGFLIGEYDGLLADYIKNCTPGYKRADLMAFSSPVPPGTAWDDDRVETFDYDGLRIALPQTSYARHAKIVLDGNDQYAVAFVRAAELDTPGFQPTPTLLPATNDAAGMLEHAVEIPEGTARAGFDVVLVVPVAGDNIFAIGGLTFTDR